MEDAVNILAWSELEKNIFHIVSDQYSTQNVYDNSYNLILMIGGIGYKCPKSQISAMTKSCAVKTSRIIFPLKKEKLWHQKYETWNVNYFNSIEEVVSKNLLEIRTLLSTCSFCGQEEKKCVLLPDCLSNIYMNDEELFEKRVAANYIYKNLSGKELFNYYRSISRQLNNLEVYKKYNVDS